MEILRQTAALRVQQQTKDRPVEEVTQLSLTGVPFAFELFKPFAAHLTHLNLVFLKPKLRLLSDLQLNNFPVLRVLDVSDNSITVPEALTPCNSVKRVLISNNSITTMDEVRRLASSFPMVEIVDVADNAVESTEVFEHIFDAFAHLATLNSKLRDGSEVMVEDSDESEDDSDEEEDDSDDEEEEGEECSESDSEVEEEMPTKTRKLE